MDSKGTILVADDDKLITAMAVFRLEREGYKVVTAEDGKEALRLIQSIKPDLIISDLMMPYFSGLELVEHLRDNLQSSIPIIILSASGQEKTVMRAFKLGADDFITKPFSLEELLMRIKKLLRK